VIFIVADADRAASVFQPAKKSRFRGKRPGVKGLWLKSLITLYKWEEQKDKVND